MNDDEQVAIYNPDIEDFTRTYDINGTGEPVAFTIHAGEVEKFPRPVAEHLKKHLAKHITFKRGWQKSNFEAVHAEVLKEIEVNLHE